MVIQKNLLRRNGFTFKQFFIAHDQCAMKVGTDSILLGSWAPVAHINSILDIGTGSGLLAIMLAQRTSESVMIDAVEIDAVAAMQAAQNCADSPWGRRTSVHCADIGDWVRQTNQRYSLIVSNPPYYQPGVACATTERELARYTRTLDYALLLENSAQLIENTGFLCVVLPMSAGEQFIKQAAIRGWCLRFRVDVRETASHDVHRVLLALSLKTGKLFQTSLVIRGPDQRYSDAFCALTQNFYLFM